MNHREFSKRVALLGVGLPASAIIGQTEEPKKSPEDWYEEPAKKLPVRKFDVMVAGGGTALHSYFNLWKAFPGVARKQVVRGIPQEIVDRLAKVGGTSGPAEMVFGDDYDSVSTAIDTEIYRLVTFERLVEAGGFVAVNTLLAGASMGEERIKGVIGESRARREASVAIRNQVSAALVELLRRADLPHREMRHHVERPRDAWAGCEARDGAGPDFARRSRVRTRRGNRISLAAVCGVSRKRRRAGRARRGGQQLHIRKMKMRATQNKMSVLALSLALIGGEHRLSAAAVEGALKIWHPVTITFTGKAAGETEATFRDHRLDVTFTKGEKSFLVPGYFAADGNAAETSATNGNKWRVKFTPNEGGAWTYSVSFREGTNIAVPAVSSPTAGKSAGLPDGETGSFTVKPADAAGPGFYGKGMLAYVGEHYLQFQGSKNWFVKAGAGSPEDFFGYQDFDNTFDNPIKKSGTQKKDTYLYEDHGFGAGKGVGLHRYLFHLKHWQEGDPTWQGGKGKGIIGAINYLSEIGANSVYHIILTRGDDSDNTWPWADHDSKLIYDVSKLDQWDIVYSHMDRKGINADLYLCESDNAHYLNGGIMGTERSIYFREIVARFGHHLGLRYNLGEENGLQPEQIKSNAAYLNTLDVYGHPVGSHSSHKKDEQHRVFEPLLGFKDLDGFWYQLHVEHHTEVIGWREKSAQAGHKWVIAADETWPIDENQIDRAESYAWQVMTAGGEGMNVYVGYRTPSYNDVGLEDFSRMKPTLDCVISPAALLSLPQVNRHLTQMASTDGFVGNLGKNEPPFCFAKEGSIYVVYHKKGSDLRLDLSKQSGTFAVKWWNPRKSDGGGLQDGSVKTISGGDIRSLGNPPSDPDSSWAALVMPAN